MLKNTLSLKISLAKSPYLIVLYLNSVFLDSNMDIQSLTLTLLSFGKPNSVILPMALQQSLITSWSAAKLNGNSNPDSSFPYPTAWTVKDLNTVQLVWKDSFNSLMMLVIRIKARLMNNNLDMEIFKLLPVQHQVTTSMLSEDNY